MSISLGKFDQVRRRRRRLAKLCDLGSHGRVLDEMVGEGRVLDVGRDRHCRDGAPARPRLGSRQRCRWSCRQGLERQAARSVVLYLRSCSGDEPGSLQKWLSLRVRRAAKQSACHNFFFLFQTLLHVDSGFAPRDPRDKVRVAEFSDDPSPVRLIVWGFVCPIDPRELPLVWFELFAPSCEERREERLERFTLPQFAHDDDDRVPVGVVEDRVRERNRQGRVVDAIDREDHVGVAAI